MDGGELQAISGASIFRQSGHVHLSDLLCPGPSQLRHHTGQYDKQPNKGSSNPLIIYSLDQLVHLLGKSSS